MCCCSAMCSMCKGVMLVVLGLLVLVAWYFNWVSTSWWWAAVGAVVILKGVLHLVPVSCPHSTETKKAAPRKKR